MAGSVLLSGLIALMGAWAWETSRRMGRAGNAARRLFFVSMVAALAMPMVLHAAAWEAAAGKFGWLSLTQTGARTYVGLAGNYSGMTACIWIHGIFGSALVTLATIAGLRRVPPVLLDQARLDMGRRACWWKIQLPLASPWWITALLATASLAASEMTVADLYGVRTLADEFYLFYAASPDLWSVTRMLVLPVAFSIAVIVVWLTRLKKRIDVQAETGGYAIEETQSDEILDRTDASGDEELPRGRWIAGIVLVSLAVLVAGVPVFSLLIKIGHEVVVSETDVGETVAQVSWSPAAFAGRLVRAPVQFFHEYKWTHLIAIGSAIWSLALAWPLAALGREKPNIQRAVDLLSVIAFLLPGPIVGLVVVHCFQLDSSFLRRLYQETLVPTLCALSFRSVPVAYWILRTGYQGIRDETFQAARLDFSWNQRVWKLDFPLLGRSLMIASVGVAIVATGDVPATLPVIPPGVSTVGTRLFALLHSGARYQEASLAIWHVLTIVVLVWGLSAMKRRQKSMRHE